ncbi:50S ribosomal protein L4 [Mycoplasma crocodyli]|uniref:Large ribosomal subunit protein uL4 n=1 Tax=Mycoplasma crocodyli (strain ATCC 51981 / MP145) TaxID=512564 RepID=D5E4V7_MYCCM|nr:50S ribosomal protein L4 [Mycoplasma crocodyli]ADE19817.1 50S ribosomal protein L4 [Mycoplasma crocodyli MP145]
MADQLKPTTKKAPAKTTTLKAAPAKEKAPLKAAPAKEKATIKAASAKDKKVILETTKVKEPKVVKKTTKKVTPDIEQTQTIEITKTVTTTLTKTIHGEDGEKIVVKTTTKAPKKEVVAKEVAPKKVVVKETTPKKEVVKKETAPKKAVAKEDTKVTVETSTKNLVKFDAKLPSELFASEKIYEQAIFDTILSDRASRRQGTHQVKNRAQVSGTGKKPWRQKGTGRARTGSLRTPVFVGGGRAFGPQSEKNYSLKVNKKVRYAAFVSALTLLANDKAVAIDDLKLNKISTKELVKKLTTLKINDVRHILIVTEDETLFKSAANLSNVVTVKPHSLSVELLIAADVMVISKNSLKVLEGKIK